MFSQLCFLRQQLCIFFFVTLLVVGSCTNPNGEEIKVAPKTYESSSSLSIVTKNDLTTKIDQGLDVYNIPATMKPGFLAKVQYDIDVVRLVYRTKNPYSASDESISVSGLLIIPRGAITNKEGGIGMVNILHGTITNPSEVASKNFNEDNFALLAQYFASQGLVVMMPDYIGYGESESTPHPYEHAASLGRTSADMILAVKEFCVEESIKLNNKVFLTGYSEGGFACVATHKYIEENNIDVDIFKSVAGAGAVDKVGFLKSVLTQTQRQFFMPTYLWVLYVYQQLYGIPLSSYDNVFAEPYLTFFKGINFDYSYGLRPYLIYLNGLENFTLKGALMDMSLDFLIPTSLIRQEFRDAIINESAGASKFLDAFRDNTIIDWKPKAELVLCHGEDDTYVFPLNSINAEVAMKLRGGNVRLHPLFAGKNHFTAVSDYILLVFTELGDF